MAGDGHPLALEEQVLVAELTVWRYTVAAVIVIYGMKIAFEVNYAG